jgi:hypothetical protein
MRDSLVAGVYDQVIDRESAYEKLTNATSGKMPRMPQMTDG